MSNRDKSCGGSILRDQDGNYIERYGCEVHLFDPGICGWERIRLAEAAEARKGPYS